MEKDIITEIFTEIRIDLLLPVIDALLAGKENHFEFAEVDDILFEFQLRVEALFDRADIKIISQSKGI